MPLYLRIVAILIAALFSFALFKTIFAPLQRSFVFSKKKASQDTQRLAQQFWSEINKNKKGLWQSYSLLHKSFLGTTTVYQGTRDQELTTNNWGALYDFGKGGIHVPSNSFAQNKQPNFEARALLCHEIIHAQQDNFFSVSSFYAREYEAELTTIKTLYALGMYNEMQATLKRIISHLVALSPLALTTVNNEEAYTSDKHPYIYGLLDGYSELRSQNKEDKKLAQILPSILAAFKQESIEHLIQQNIVDLEKRKHLLDIFYKDIEKKIESILQDGKPHSWQQRKNDLENELTHLYEKQYKRGFSAIKRLHALHMHQDIYTIIIRAVKPIILCKAQNQEQFFIKNHAHIHGALDCYAQLVGQHKEDKNLVCIINNVLEEYKRADNQALRNLNPDNLEERITWLDGVYQEVEMVVDNIAHNTDQHSWETRKSEVEQLT